MHKTLCIELFNLTVTRYIFIQKVQGFTMRWVLFYLELIFLFCVFVLPDKKNKTHLQEIFFSDILNFSKPILWYICYKLKNKFKRIQICIQLKYLLNDMHNWYIKTNFCWASRQWWSLRGKLVNLFNHQLKTNLPRTCHICNLIRNVMF